MHVACYDQEVAKTIQIRGVPDEVHKALRVRAAEAGVSLSEYCLRELTRVAERPSNAEVLKRARGRGIRVSNDVIVESIRSWRERD